MELSIEPCREDASCSHVAGSEVEVFVVIGGAGEVAIWYDTLLGLAPLPTSSVVFVCGWVCDRQDAGVIGHRELEHRLVTSAAYKLCWRIVVEQRIVGAHLRIMSCVWQAAERDPESLGGQVVAFQIGGWQFGSIDFCEIARHHVDGYHEADRRGLKGEHGEHFAIVESRMRGGAIARKLSMVAFLGDREQAQLARGPARSGPAEVCEQVPEGAHCFTSEGPAGIDAGVGVHRRHEGVGDHAQAPRVRGREEVLARHSLVDHRDEAAQ